MNLNSVQLAGRLTRDPDVRYTSQGTAIADIGLAVNRYWKGEDGTTKEECTFLDVTAFGKTAEIVQKHLRKGSQIYVEGRLKLDQWDDRQTGAKRSKLKVVAESMQFVGPRADSPPPAKPTAPAAPPQRQVAPAPAATGPEPDFYGETPF
jgi:single-strand DNA-binding protein